MPKGPGALHKVGPLFWSVLIVIGEIGGGVIATSLGLSMIWVATSVVFGGAIVYGLSVCVSTGSANARKPPLSPSKVQK
jgi:hypothetical protein